MKNPMDIPVMLSQINNAKTIGLVSGIYLMDNNKNVRDSSNKKNNSNIKQAMLIYMEGLFNLFFSIVNIPSNLLHCSIIFKRNEKRAIINAKKNKDEIKIPRPRDKL